MLSSLIVFADNNGGYGYGGQNNNSESLPILCMPFT